MKAALVVAVVVLLVAVLVILLHPGLNGSDSIPEGKEKRDTDPVLMFEESTAYNSRPCENNSDNNAYNKFVFKHVLPEGFDTSSWIEYLEKKSLCDRPLQSFVDYENKEVLEKICNGAGKNRRINLCTSTSKVRLHVLNVKTDCSFTIVSSRAQYVTVACDKVDNQCLPVHFQSSQDSEPKRTDETCEP